MPLLTPEQAAAELGISEDTLRDMRRAGEIPYVNIGRGRKRETPRYDVADLEAWKEARKQRVQVQCPSSFARPRRTARTATTSNSAVADFLEALEKRRGGKRSKSNA